MDIFDEIRGKVSLIDIAIENGVEHSGRKSKCPLCDYRTKTFFMDDDHFYCHHCKVGGDVFQLISELKKIDRVEAMRVLAERLGIEFTEQQREKEEKERVKLDIYIAFADTYTPHLDQKSIDYLTSRGLTLDFIKQKKIGFVKKGVAFENKALNEIGLPGLVQGRMLIPFWQGGRIVYFSGRSVDGEEPKYMNQKGPKTYAGTIRGPVLYAAEGPFDQLLAEQNGYNCIALAGSGEFPKLHGGIKKVVLAFDGDEAGQKYIDKFALNIYSAGYDVEIILFSDGQDMADYLAGGGKLEQKEHIGLWTYYLDIYSLSPHDKQLKEILYKIMQRWDDLEREDGFKQIKEIRKSPISAIRSDYKKFSKSKNSTEYYTDDGFKFGVPHGYELTKYGIATDKECISFEPYYISRVGTNRHNNMEYIETTFRVNGATKKRVIPRQSIAMTSELIKESNHGAPVNSANALGLIKFFDAWLANNRDVLPRFEVVSQLGWVNTDGDKFALSDRIIGATSDDNMIYKGAIPEKAYKRKGTLSKWVDTIKLLKGLNSGHVARFMVYAGFTSAILEKINVRPFIVHLHGDTSLGKTTALRIPASIYGAPLEGHAMIRWHNTKNFIVRYMENLKNVPLVIDELSSETKPTFDDVIYMMESGISKGKALRDDPSGIAEQRTFRLGVFSSGEPPILGDQSPGGASIRVWEFHGNPFGENNRELIQDLETGLYDNNGVAIDAFLRAFEEKKDLYTADDAEKFLVDDPNRSNVENRMLKTINPIWVTGRIINELFGLGFDVDSDIEHIYKHVAGAIDQSTRTIDKIIEDIESHVAENPTAYPIVESENLFDQNLIVRPVNNQMPTKIYGYIHKKPVSVNGEEPRADLLLIHGSYVKRINEQRNIINSGKYIVNLLKERGVISSSNVRKQINNHRARFLVFENFFSGNDVPEETKEEDIF